MIFLNIKGPELFRVLLKAGDVLVFYPEDVHMPGLQVEKSEPAKKVVFKTRCKSFIICDILFL